MKNDQASRTAHYMALFRALETTRRARPRLCQDPFAKGFLPPLLRAVVTLSSLPILSRWIPSYIDRRWPGVRTSALARTRCIDDVVEAALAAGCEQVVILGAGFDARAYRLPCLAGAKIFEVDHPATSAAKRATVVSALGRIPAQLSFVTIDFNSQRLAEVMLAAGYEAQRRSLFVWEGVTNYLTEAAVDATLRWCSAAAQGSTVVFTYIDRRVIDAPETFYGTEKLFATLQAAQERWTFGVDPPQLRAFLAERGLTLVEDSGAADYRLRYYGPSARQMRGYEFYRIAVANVATS